MVKQGLASILLLGLGCLARAQDVFGDDHKSYLLLPAEAISSGVVSQVEFSKSGKYITYRREAIANFESELLGKESPKKSEWFRYDRTSKINVKLAVPAASTIVMLFGDEETVFYMGDDARVVQGFVNIKTGQSTKTNLDIGSISYYGERADAPYLVFKSGDRSAGLLSPNGNALTIPLPDKAMLFSPVASDAASITFAGMMVVSPAKFGHFVYQRSSGTTTFKEVDRQIIMSEMQVIQPEQKFLFDWVGEVQYIKTNEAVKTPNPLVPARAKLTTSRSFVRFSPNSDSVAYLVSGALLIREIKPIDATLALRLANNAAKQKAINDSKQAALALIMCASDLDDVLPGAEGWEAKVLPYSQDMDLLRRFNYTFKGGNMANIESPATTEMGFILGPGGRAVAYCDGHVKWIPNP